MWTTVRSAKVTVLEQMDKEIMKVIHGYMDKAVNNFQRTQPRNIRVLFCFVFPTFLLRLHSCSVFCKEH